MGCTTFVAGVIGLPMPNGLVPQAPVHTDSLTNYETRLDVIKTKDHDIAEVRRPLVEATSVTEQRVSHFLMGLALWGTMTGPLLVVLHTMPAAVFAGVFFVVGVSHNTLFARTATDTARSGDPSRPMGFFKNSSTSIRSAAFCNHRTH